MPVADPRAGKTLLWLISCFLFLAIVAGGGCLVLYMILPPSPSTNWLPFLGVALVCLPWSFWFLTFIYRIISRACGFRMVIGGGAGGENEANKGTDNPAAAASPGGDVKRVHFGAEVVVVDGKDEEGENGKAKSSSRSSSSSSNDINSVHSHESEMPLAFSMAT